MISQGISAVENILGRFHVLNHEHVPAACFTHPEISMVGLTEEQAKQRATDQGFKLGKSVGHFRANSKALAEVEADGICKVQYLEKEENLQLLCSNFLIIFYEYLKNYLVFRQLYRCCSTKTLMRFWECIL